MIDRGDILLPQKAYAADRIVLTVEKGYATKIEGGLDAELLTDYMASFCDPEAYAISHIGWGSQPRARWSRLGLVQQLAPHAGELVVRKTVPSALFGTSLAAWLADIQEHV
ncbi:hypothetical protein J2739_004356 [Variovorax soli]|uniref:Uncharacterized protein n=1 Tax=Variovorax soli TaxID=376815 RepID=A0ABU1NJD3_9BURK|nr:hypothetical protein [Variovorax soli]